MGGWVTTSKSTLTRRTISSYHFIHLSTLTLLSALLFSACGGHKQPTLPEPYPTTPAHERHLRTYDAFWEGISDQYLYAESTDFDWGIVRPQTRRKIENGLIDSEFDELMRRTVEAFPDNTLTYRTRSERISEDLSNTLSYEGIGAYISVENDPEPHVILLVVIAGSPAEKAGLRTHDSIYAVDGHPLTAQEGLKIVDRVRGPEGSVVTLDVQSPDGSKRVVRVTRGRVTASDELRWGVIGMSKTGLIRLPIAATDRLANVVTGALQELAEEGISSLIIDMRIAHSGSSWPLAEMLSLFYDGPMGTMHSRGATRTLNLIGNDVLNSQQIPLALLVGPDTQGASEVFAAGLQATDRAIVIGLPTPGRVMGFSQFVLPDGSKVFYATSSYHTPDGLDLGLTGVHPDILVDARWDEVDDNSDPVVSRALLQLTQ